MMRTACLIAFLTGLAITAQAQQVKGVLYTTSGKLPGYLSANGNGDIVVAKRKGDGVKRTIRRETIRRIDTPKHPDITKIENALKQKKYDDVITEAGKISNDIKWLGWGGWTHYLQAQAYLAKKDFRNAKSAAEQGLRYARAEGRTDQLQSLIVQIDIMLNPNDKNIEARVRRMRPSPIKYKTLGDISAAKAKSQKNNRQLLMESALEYMKVVLVYSKEGLGNDVAAQSTRREAYVGLIEVLNLLNDTNKAKEFEAMMKQEYGG